MRNNTRLLRLTFLVSVSFIFYSCQKSIEMSENFNPLNKENLSLGRIKPYKFERINIHNFFSQGWEEQQVNVASGVTTFSNLSEHVEIVCGPENTTDPRLINGAVTMNLPTSADGTLRRIRLRRGGYSGTLLSDLTELKYSTYVVHNSPTIMVLQIDVNGDAEKDFNINFEPRAYAQPAGFPPVVLNTWQQWDALHQGVWHIVAPVVTLPAGLLDLTCTIPEVIEAYPTARIIDTPPQGHNGEGVRFTIGGDPRSLYDNTLGYFDALIIGTKNEQHSTLYDFMCDQSGN